MSGGGGGVFANYRIFKRHVFLINPGSLASRRLHSLIHRPLLSPNTPPLHRSSPPTHSLKPCTCGEKGLPGEILNQKITEGLYHSLTIPSARWCFTHLICVVENENEIQQMTGQYHYFTIFNFRPKFYQTRTKFNKLQANITTTLFLIFDQYFTRMRNKSKKLQATSLFHNFFISDLFFTERCRCK